MKKHNPMARKEIREKVSKKLTGRPMRLVRGGNGKGPTSGQLYLFLALRKNEKPKMEFVVSTGKGSRAKGLPTHYKIDVALPEHKIAVEVDGLSHNLLCRKEQDKKKDRFLRGVGWKVLRFTNRQVMEHLEECAQEVMSIT